MNRITFGVLAAALLLATTHAEADWDFRRGDNASSNRQEVPANLGAAPGISSILASESRSLPADPLVLDADGDGSPDLLMPYRGSVGLFNLAAGGFKWVSPNVGVDRVVGVGDFDGDGAATEVLATSARVGGGLFIFDLASGGLLASLSELVDRTGVAADEVTIHDFGDDGRVVIIFGAATPGVDRLWVARFDPGYATRSLLELTYAGYNNLTTARAGVLLPGGGEGIVLQQGYYESVWAACGPSDAGAACDPETGTICFCAEGSTGWLYPDGLFAPPMVADLDGDGDDEMVEIASRRPHSKAVAVFDYEGGDPAGPLDGPAARLWGWDHTAQDPVAQIAALPTAPVDLDGDGDLDIVVTIANDGGSETDGSGGPADDGVDLVGGLSVLVYDGPTGAVLLSIPDAFAWGVEDLDGDGTPELITSPAPGWAFGEGLTGWELSCSPACVATPAWSAPSARMQDGLGLLDGLSLPSAGLSLMQADGDPQLELLVHGPAGLEVLEPDGLGGVTVLSSTAMPSPYSSSAAADVGAVVSAGGRLQAFDSSLSSTSPLLAVPRQGEAEWRAFAATPAGPWVTVVDRVASWEDGGPRTYTLGGEVAFAQDLDGDGNVELVSYANAGVEGATALRIRLLTWDPAASTFALRWEVQSAAVPGLVGARGGGGMHWAPGDFDGVGSRDVAFSGVQDGVSRVFLLDGDSGTLDGTLEPSSAAATQTAFRPLDVVDAAGAPGSDGIDDILYMTTAQLEILSQGHVGPLSAQPLQLYGYLAAWADLDGDGSAELFTALAAAQPNTGEAITMTGGTPSALWGPVDMGPITGSLDLLSFASLDAEPGMDILFLNGDGSLAARSGVGGAMLPGFPVYLDEGTLPGAEPSNVDLPTSLVVLDVDDDGYDEAVVGTRRGWVYALNIDPQEVAAPTLLWSIEVPSGVTSLGASDTDGDGFSEVIAATEDRSVLVLDTAGVALEITGPPPSACYGEAAIEITGTAAGLATVDLYANGVLMAAGLDATSGAWAGTVVLSSAGTYSIRAEGFDASGALTAVAFDPLTFEGDADGDGTTECGGDCAPLDGTVGPLVPEVCEDGLDQDCDGVDAPCGDDDDSGTDDDDSLADDDDSGADDDDSLADDDDSLADDDDDTASTGDDDDTVDTMPSGGCSCRVGDGGGSAPLALILPLLLLSRRRRG